MKKILLISLVLCYGLEATGLSSGPKNAANDKPDLLHMLDYFKGKSDMAMMVNFVKEMKMSTEIFKGMFDICPTCQKIFQDAAKSNPGLEIINKIIEDRVPDLKDMYNLATKGTGDMSAAFVAERKKDKKVNAAYQELFSSDENLLKSTTKLEQFFYVYTEKHFTLDPTLVKAVYDGNVVTTSNNLAQVNLLEMITFMKKNANVVEKITFSLGRPPINFVNMLTILKDVDISNLQKIKAVQEGINNDKYAVGQTLVTDPDAVKFRNLKPKIQQMVKEKSQDQVSAESVLMDLVTTFGKMLTRVVKTAEQDKRISSA